MVPRRSVKPLTEPRPLPRTYPWEVGVTGRMEARIHFAVVCALTVPIVLAGCTGGSEAGTMIRGDEAFARGEIAEALAEYRLALSQGDPSAPILARAAHAYTATGRISEAVEHYREAVALDPELADLAASDLLKFAREAIREGDGLQATEAVSAAMVLRRGVGTEGIALPLARHLVRTGRHDRALPFFVQAARETNDSAEVLYEQALAYDEAGLCENALVLFDRAWGRLTVAQRADADWRTGSCSMQLGARVLEEGDLEVALGYFDTTIKLGEPRGQIPDAWFQRGEILILREECTVALQAFEEVLLADPAPGLRARAEERIEELRFPQRGADGPC